MSQENIEVLRRLTDAFNQRDLPAFLACSDRDIEVVSDRALIGAPTYHGRNGVEQFFRDVAAAWEELRLEPADITPVGNDAFAVVGESYGKGRTTGAPFTARAAALVSFKHGKVARCEFFASEREALEAAGLKE